MAELFGMICELIIGLALFLFGMNVMGDALKKRAGSRLKTILGNMTSNPLKGFLLGLGVTAIIQSSSATTVMVVGFVNSGTMLLAQTVGVIMGANVGTAVTAWLTGLSGVGNGTSGGSGNTELLLTLFKATTLTAVCALIGIVFYMFCKREKLRDMGMILLGFAVLMGGMSIMSDAVSGLADKSWFGELLVKFENPILGLLAGMILTAIVQSSSASVGILQALTLSGSITFGAAIPIIMGQNIGTCITAMLSSIGTSKNARRTALIHLYFNLIGVAVWLTTFLVADSLVALPLVNDAIDMWGVAAVHTVFKLLSVLIMFPFTKQLVKLAQISIKNGSGEEEICKLDERLLETPAVALETSKRMVCEMADRACEGLNMSLDMLTAYDVKTADVIRDLESKVDQYEDNLGSYLVKLSSHPMVDREHYMTTEMLHVIGDFERISDHSVNILESIEEMNDKHITFTPQAMEEIAVMVSAVREILAISKEAFCTGDMELAAKVEPLEQVVDDLRDRLKARHIDRLQKGGCTIEMGFVLADLLTNLERVSDHCSNVAGCLIEVSHKALDMHSYLDHQRNDSAEFAACFAEYQEKYAIPENQ